MNPSRMIVAPSTEPATVTVALMLSRNIGVTTIFNLFNPEAFLRGMIGGRSGMARLDRDVAIVRPFFIFLFPIAAI